MSTKTEILKLTKPAATDIVDISVINENMDIIDENSVSKVELDTIKKNLEDSDAALKSGYETADDAIKKEFREADATLKSGYESADESIRTDLHTTTERIATVESEVEAITKFKLVKKEEIVDVNDFAPDGRESAGKPIPKNLYPIGIDNVTLDNQPEGSMFAFLRGYGLVPWGPIVDIEILNNTGSSYTGQIHILLVCLELA